MKTKKPYPQTDEDRLFKDPVLKDNPFRVPEDYFDKFAEKLDIQKDSVKNVQFVPAFRQKVKRFAVAAVMLGLVSLGVLLIFTLSRPVPEQYSDKLSRNQEPVKKKTATHTADTSGKAVQNTPVRKSNTPEVKTPALTGIVSDNSIEALVNEGITDDDIIEYLLDEGFDVIDLSYQP